MGPDEDHHIVDNNGYTNVNAAINLYFGAFAGCTCKDVLKVNDADFEKFTQIARSLVLLYDKVNDYHPQFEGYENDTIKQADVVLIGYPLQLPMNASTKKNNLDLYANLTRETGPAMTWAMHTIGYLEIDDQEKAMEYFFLSFLPYVREPFMIWNEAIEGTVGIGNFITGAGGFLQSLINGYGGVRLHSDSLTIGKSSHPEGFTQGLEFKGLTYLNNIFSLKITETGKEIRILSVDPSHPVQIWEGTNNRGNILAGYTLTVPLDTVITLKSGGFMDSCEMYETVLGQELVNNPAPSIDNEWTLGST
jgi:trehalose/maltose hydrolase-like predicted phosphorylase